MPTLIPIDDLEYSAGANPRAKSRWEVEGTNDEADALNTILSGTPATALFLLRNQIDMKTRKTGPDPSKWVWTADVNYSATPIPTKGEVKFQSSSRGGREKITQSLEVPHKVVLAGRTSPDTKNAIGVDGRGNVKGTEVVVPKAQFSFETGIDPTRYSHTYAAGLDELTGTTNDRPFFGRPKNTVLFLGHETDGTITVNTATNVDDSVIRIKFFFAYSREDKITIGDLPELTVPGWHYIDVRYEDDVSNDFKIRRPVSAQVHRVYTNADFRQFGLGS